MSPLETLARAIRTEFRNQGVIWEDEPFDPSQLMMQTGAVADLPAIAKAALLSLIRMAEGNEKVQLWLEAMLDG